MPRYVERELAAYLRCGILAHGFARVRCQARHDEIVVAFSCKRRGVCSSCTARRMADTAAHLVDRVMPRVDALAACAIERRVTPHGLRHTANNELRRVANGEVVRAIIGHATEAMTHHYSHVGEDEKREAVARVFAIVRGGEGGERVVSGVVGNDADTPATALKDKDPSVSAEVSGGATQI